jgi:hypothetical protein
MTWPVFAVDNPRESFGFIAAMYNMTPFFRVITPRHWVGVFQTIRLQSLNH